MADLMKIPAGSDQQTFKYDEGLPSLPLPPLDQTLERYLDSVHPFVTDGEFAHTKELVERFANGQGKELQKLLVERASKCKNWVEEWWENYAYLENRTPLLPFCSMMGVSDLELIGWKPCLGTQIKRAALYLYYAVEFWQLIRRERFMVDQTADGKTKFSMSQYRHLFNCNRCPLPKRDRLDAFFKTESEGSCPSHVIVLCNGQAYLVDAVDSLSGALISPPEWELELQVILSDAEQNPGPGLGRLTCDNRDIWAENRAHLQRLSPENAHSLDLIDTAMLVATLDCECPSSETELARNLLGGDYANRWADKSIGLIFFRNGIVGGISEHTAFDGLVSVSTKFYILDSLKKIGGVYRGSNKVVSLKTPKRLDFTLDDKIRTELVNADIRHAPMKASVVMARERFGDFGKKAITSRRVHPDTFVQLALQLAYYSLHGRVAACYETATTRAFYHGRTETHRPCTPQVARWVSAMNDPEIEATKKVRLMKEAVKRNDELMKDARQNKGCDRHLFGLYCVALESGLPIPELFSDPAYAKSGGGGNFTLSTSLVGFLPAGGGVAAMTKEGYGIFYNFRPDSIHFMIAVQREGETTSTSKFFKMLSLKLNEMLSLLDTTASPQEIKSKI